MFRIKICGLTSVADALVAAETGADAIGLNFYSASPRCVTRAAACEIAQAMPSGVLRVGVFVNASAEEIRATCLEVGLDAVQLHGDEPPELVAALAGTPVIRAVRLRAENRAAVLEHLTMCETLGHRPRMLLVDAFRAGEFGGTGATADWSLALEIGRNANLPPLVLAGGLTPENVVQAIEQVGPAAVDTASGVECAPGRKDASRVRQFVAEAQAALDRLRSS